MTSAIRNARKRLFAQDLDVQKYAAKDKADEDHLAPPSDEGDRTDRRKRDVPPGLSDRDAAILGTVKRRANVLDKDFSICGVKFGWTVIIDLVPGVGDAVHPALGYLLIVRHARKAKIPRALTQRMILNLAISASIGIVPGMGAILLAGYRVNVRNARLLEKFLLQRGERAAAAKAAQSGATNEKRSTGRDGDHDDDDPDAGDGDGDGDKRRGSSSGQGAEDVGSSLSDARLGSPSHPRPVRASHQEDAAPHGAGNGNGNGNGNGDGDGDGDGSNLNIGARPRPARSTLDVVVPPLRDSRFIEDVS